MVALPPDSAGTTQYDITVRSGRDGEHIYRTMDIVFDAGSDRLLSRGTRVWKAIRIQNGAPVGNPVVLKDAWVSTGRQREGDIDARIRRSAMTLHEDDHARLVDMLLTVLAHGDVVVANAPDRTADLAETLKRKRYGRLGPSQTHYRIVYREVCTPLRDELSLQVVYKAVGDICCGMSTPHVVASR